MLETATFVLALIAVILGAVGTVLHFIAPRTKTTVDDVWAARFDEMKAFVEDLVKRLAKPAAMLLVVLLLAAPQTACSASARQRAIATALATTNAAAAGFEKFDSLHQQAIVTKAPDLETGKAELAKYRQTQLKIEQGLAATYRAIATAATLDDDHSLAGIAAAWAIVEAELHELGVL